MEIPEKKGTLIIIIHNRNYIKIYEVVKNLKFVLNYLKVPEILKVKEM